MGGMASRKLVKPFTAMVNSIIWRDAITWAAE